MSCFSSRLRQSADVQSRRLVYWFPLVRVDDEFAFLTRVCLYKRQIQTRSLLYPALRVVYPLFFAPDDSVAGFLGNRAGKKMTNI